MKTKSNYLSIWYEALETPHGLAVETDDRATLRQQLYAIRRGYPELSCLSIIFPQNPAELWIVRREESDG